ncbi:MAG: DUF59 domain-containing protein [Methanomassiliicoccales archaeon]|nr:DUF59 domain-containing protein [Methanomassiliicoccales archaeon]NYT15862.1 DUF59 domain-containing protein [Methanomassiliicoccales archaeon]
MRRTEDVLRTEIIESLRGVMIPESNASVYDLDLVHDVQIKDGHVRLIFSPGAMLCSSVQVAFSIKQAVGSVSGVRKVEIHVADYERVVLSKNVD